MIQPTGPKKQLNVEVHTSLGSISRLSAMVPTIGDAAAQKIPPIRYQPSGVTVLVLVVAVEVVVVVVVVVGVDTSTSWPLTETGLGPGVTTMTSTGGLLGGGGGGDTLCALAGMAINVSTAARATAAKVRPTGFRVANVCLNPFIVRPRGSCRNKLSAHCETRQEVAVTLDAPPQ